MISNYITQFHNHNDFEDLNTVKILKFRIPKKFAVITLKFEQGGSTNE